MRNKLYVIYDGVAEESGPVFEAKNDGIALRNFERTVADSPYREDYSLVCVGSIEHNTSIIEAYIVPVEVNAKLSMVEELEEEEV